MIKITDQNLAELGKLLDPTGIIKTTREELLAAFKKIVEMVQQMKENNIKELNRIISTFDSLESKLESDTSKTLTKTEKAVAAELESLLRRFSAEQKKIDDKLATIENGKDANEEKIVQDVLTQIKLPEYKETVLDNGEQILNKITGLIEISDIKDLKDILEEIKKIKNQNRIFGGGGFSKLAMDIHIISNEVVAGSGTTFTLSHTPNPANSLKLYGLGQRLPLTTKYSLSGRIITTTDNWSAGDVLADYEI